MIVFLHRLYFVTAHCISYACLLGFEHLTTNIRIANLAVVNEFRKREMVLYRHPDRALKTSCSLVCSHCLRNYKVVNFKSPNKYERRIIHSVMRVR